MCWPVPYPWNTECEGLLVWMNISSLPIPVEFCPNGPLALGAKTYFGGRILDMFGKDLLLNSPGVVSELSWGGICIDLLKDPLSADSDTLLDNWLHSKIFRDGSSNSYTEF